MRTALPSVVIAAFLAACVVDSSSKPSSQPPTPTTSPTTTPTTPTTTPTSPTKPVQATCPNKSNAAASYMELSADECTRALVRCPEGHEGFTDACGCGCIAPATPTKPDTTPTTPASNCPNEATAGVSYKSKDAGKCAAMRFACPAGQKPFSSAACGCGCEPNTTATTKCPEAAITGVDYKSKDTSFCARARIACPTGAKPFSSQCGCGCIPLSK